MAVGVDGVENEKRAAERSEGNSVARGVQRFRRGEGIAPGGLQQQTCTKAQPAEARRSQNPHPKDLQKRLIVGTRNGACPVDKKKKVLRAKRPRRGTPQTTQHARDPHPVRNATSTTQQPTASDPATKEPPQEPARNHAREGRSAHQAPAAGPAAASSSSPNSAIVAAATSPSSLAF